MATKRRFYAAVGNVRGDCQHAHRTVSGADACARRDARACRAHGGYSDRIVCVMWGTARDADTVDPTAEEAREIADAKQAPLHWTDEPPWSPRHPEPAGTRDDCPRCNGGCDCTPGKACPCHNESED